MVDSGLVGDSILSRAAYGGDGYGFGRGRGGANFEFDGSVINAKIEGNKEANTNQHTSILAQIDSAADRARDAANNTIADRHFTSLTDKMNDNARFTASEFNALTREQTENARVAAKCCCDAQLLAIQNQAKTDAGMATILANQASDSRVSDAVSNAQQNAKLDAILSSRGGNGNGNGN